MSTDTETPLIQKTLELCRTILDQPEFQTMRRQIDTFLSDESAQTQYQLVTERSQKLQQKQQMGVPLTNEEIMEFEKVRDDLISNPVARGFLDAQQGMHKVQESVSQYVSKTFELGRLPTEEDFSAESCGPSCGCGH